MWKKKIYKASVLLQVNMFRIIYLSVKCSVSEELSQKSCLLPKISRNWNDV